MMNLDTTKYQKKCDIIRKPKAVLLDETSKYIMKNPLPEDLIKKAFNNPVITLSGKLL